MNNLMMIGIRNGGAQPIPEEIAPENFEFQSQDRIREESGFSLEESIAKAWKQLAQIKMSF